MSNPLTINGSAVLALAGSRCVVMAQDKRFGVGAQGVAFQEGATPEQGSGDAPERVRLINSRTLLGMSGLMTDVLTVHEELAKRTQLYRLREDREMKPSTFDSVVSNFLYSRRFGPYFVEPLIAGLEGPEFKPFISGQDVLGCPVSSSDYVVAGSAEHELYGLCEQLYKPGLGPDELFEVAAQIITQATDRDCLSGYGAIIYILTPEKLVVREVYGRQD